MNETTELVHVFVNGEEIQATPSHPFYVPKFGWTKAINLRTGDILVLSNGEYVVVEAIQHEILEAPIKVYNFEVEDFHTYFVGDNCVLVHNICTRDEPRIENGNSKEGWQHIEERHITGTAPGGDLFAPGTTREQVEKAIQVFEKKMVANGKKALIRVVVDSTDLNRVITIFPVRGGG